MADSLPAVNEDLPGRLADCIQRFEDLWPPPDEEIARGRSSWSSTTRSSLSGIRIAAARLEYVRFREDVLRMLFGTLLFGLLSPETDRSGRIDDFLAYMDRRRAELDDVLHRSKPGQDIDAETLPPEQRVTPQELPHEP